MNFGYHYDYEALKLANNENDWMLYFKSIAKHYVKAFLKNYEKLKKWEQLTKENDSGYKTESIKNCLTNYYNLFLALEPNENGELNIEKKILNKFHKISDPKNIKNAQDAYQSLGLSEYQILGEAFTLNQLMNITLSFFHEEAIRVEFFKKIISSSQPDLKKMTLNQMLPQNRVNNFQNA